MTSDQKRYSYGLVVAGLPPSGKYNPHDGRALLTQSLMGKAVEVMHALTETLEAVSEAEPK